jgi:ABC-type Fe3+/spermidine/putrescine transport system ATPase subunit
MTRGASTEGLGYRYPGARSAQWSLRDASLDVGPGEVLAVVGPSGSGKTTLLRLLCGLLTPTAGSIRIGGVDVTRTPPERRPVAMVFQGYALFPHLTVRDNIAFGPRVRREPRDAAAVRVGAAAETLGLTELPTRRCSASTSRCRVSTRSCAPRHAGRSPAR